jgi:hypothetical protein
MLLLLVPIDDIALAMCRGCLGISMLFGSSLESPEPEFLDALSRDEKDRFLRAVVAMRARVLGPEAALEEAERCVADAR